MATATQTQTTQATRVAGRRLAGAALKRALLTVAWERDEQLREAKRLRQRVAVQQAELDNWLHAVVEAQCARGEVTAHMAQAYVEIEQFQKRLDAMTAKATLLERGSATLSGVA